MVVVLLLLTLIAPLSAQRFAGRVLDVTDGDTVIVARGNSLEPLGFSPAVVRLFGIDAPEGVQPYGREAAAELSRLVMGKVIDVDMKDIDQYGRLVAEVSVGGTDVGEAMVRAGAAWHYTRYSDSVRLAAAEREARQARRGLWQSASRRSGHTFRAPCQISSFPGRLRRSWRSKGRKGLSS